MQKIEKRSSVKQDKSEQDLALIEGALCVAGRPLDLRTLGSILKTRSEKKVLKLTKNLVREYEKQGRALEVLELSDKRFVLQLKKEYTKRVRRLAIRPLLRTGPLKTLSYVAYRQPVPQTQVIEARGRHAYVHLKQMEEMGLITREAYGRTKMIQTTRSFADYFGLSHDLRALKRQLKTKLKLD